MLGSLRNHVLGGPPPEARAKKPRNYEESNDQKRVVHWIRERPQWLVMRMENALQRTHAQAARDKALGMEPGAPDLIVIFHHFSFYLEMKSTKGAVSDEQEKLHKQLRARGCSVMVGYGYDKTIERLNKIEAYWQHYNDNEKLCIGGIRGIVDNFNTRD